MMGEVKRTERGWAGHFISSQHCGFRRNTLLELGKIRIVVSTIGTYRPPYYEGNLQRVGCDRFFETMAFHAAYDGRYFDADVSRQLGFESEWSIGDPDADDLANDMHEKVVEEISKRMSAGEFTKEVA